MLSHKDVGINVKQAKTGDIYYQILPYYLKFYSIKYEIQALASSWPFFWETGPESLPSSVYAAQVCTATLYLKIIICSLYFADSQEQYENSLDSSCEMCLVFMRVVTFKCNLQCYSYWIIFSVTCVLKISTCSL